MRTFLFLFLWSLSLQAMAYSCPNYLKENSKALKVLDFIKSRQGQFTLGSCQVEIITCEEWEETNTLTPVAEILIIDRLGREAYMVLNYPQKETSFFSTKTQLNKKMLHYEKVDKLYEQEFGRTEATRFEMILDSDGKFKKIELGLYSTYKKLNQANGNDSMWIVCE